MRSGVFAYLLPATFLRQASSFIALSIKFRTFSHFPLRAYIYARLSLCLHHFVPSFVYAILFKSLRLLRLHLMQASALPSLPASITFGYYPDNGSVSAADNRVYAWHIYMPSPCFSVKFRTFLHIFYAFLGFHLQKSYIFCIFVASFPNGTDKLHKRRLLTLVLVSRNPENFKPRNKIVQ